MRKPEESLDNFNFKNEPEPTEAPSPVSLSFTGESEVLQPLVRPGDLADREAGYTYVRPASQRHSWFQGALAAGGSFALIGLMLLSAILVGMYEPTDERGGGSSEVAKYPRDLAMEQQPDEMLTPTEEPATSATAPLEGDQLRAVRPSARPRRAQPRVRLSANRPTYRFRRPSPVMTKFVPTTLIIYPENGEIKTRIEPQLTAAYKKPLT